MLNQVVLTGRLTKTPTKNDKYITLAVTRCYMDANGVYETDFIPFTASNTILDNVIEYCKKGDLIGVKGRLEMVDNKLTLIADKVTFLSQTKSTE